MTLEKFQDSRQINYSFLKFRKYIITFETLSSSLPQVLEGVAKHVYPCKIKPCSVLTQDGTVI